MLFILYWPLNQNNYLFISASGYLFSQVPFLSAITVFHLHILNSWVHIYLGHAVDHNDEIKLK